MPKRYNLVSEKEARDVTDTPVLPDPIEPTPEPKPITNSILLTTKKLLGIAEEYHAFDIDVITFINATFLTLNQLGVGPKRPFYITGETETWDNFLGDKSVYYQGIQSYVYMRVRLMFDPPTNSFIVKSFEDQIRELEWRFVVQPVTDDQNGSVEPDLPDNSEEGIEPHKKRTSIRSNIRTNNELHNKFR